MSEKAFLGVDIGGTKVAAGLIDPNGKILFRTAALMNVTGTAAQGFSSVREAIEAVFKAHPAARDQLHGIGVCSPGPLDQNTGVVVNPPNLPCWRNFPLAAEIQRSFGITAKIDNDANAAALAEAIWGAGQNYQNIFYATIGTGIGTGLVLGKRIYRGRTGNAVEAGHLSIDFRGPQCGCGKRGCIEALASGPAIAARARSKIAISDPRAKTLIELASGRVDQITTEHVGAAFHRGDDLAKEVLEESADLLTVWLGNVIDILEPDVIVVGGGVGELMSEFFKRIQEQLPQWSINPRCTEIPLVKAKYGTDAGIAGAAALSMQ
ncbi:MAG: ROK family protein [Acidobacteriia bacterium]|nr:ROK family protein [Terriglobia bacterium]